MSKQEKQEQALVIEPENELKFEGTFRQPITSYITLHNPTNKWVGFKIKTTAPKKYCVRPNSGILQPLKTIDIAVCLQAVELDLTEKSKHKFMVQTTYFPDEDVNFDQWWKELKEDSLMGTKLKCVFEKVKVDELTKSEDDNNESTNEANTAATVNTQYASLEEKTKRIGDSLTAQDDDLQLKAADELKVLRDEVMYLQRENLVLKEDILKVKSMKMQSTLDAKMPQLLLAAIIVAVLGIAIGKLFL